MHLQTTYKNITERKITNTAKIRQFVLSSCFFFFFFILQKLLIKQYVYSLLHHVHKNVPHYGYQTQTRRSTSDDSF